MRGGPGRRRPSSGPAALPLLLCLACLQLDAARGWISFVESSIDRPALSTSLGHLVVEDAATVGFFKASPGGASGGRDSNFYAAKAMFVSGDVVVGRADPTVGTLVLGGAATMTTVTSASPLGRDIAVSPNGGFLSIAGGSLLQVRAISSPSGLTLTTPQADVVFNPSSVLSSYVLKVLPASGVSILHLQCPTAGACACQTAGATCTAPVPGVQSNDPAGNLQLLVTGTGAARHVVFNDNNVYGRLQVAGTRTIAAEPPAGGTTANLNVNPVSDGRVIVARVADLGPSTLVARTVQAPDAGLNLASWGSQHILLQSNANGKVLVSGRRMISTRSGGGDGLDGLDLTLQAGGSAAVRIGGSAPTVQALVDSVGTANLQVDGNLNGSVFVNNWVVPRTGRGKLVVGGRRTIATAASDLALVPPPNPAAAAGAAARLLVSGLQPQLAAAPTNVSAGPALRLNAGAAGGAVSLLASGPAASGTGRLRLGGERTVGTASGDLILRPVGANSRVLLGRSTAGGTQAVLRSAGDPNAYLHVSAGVSTATNVTGNVYVNYGATAGSLLLAGNGASGTIEVQAGGKADMTLKPLEKLSVVGGGLQGSTIETATGTTIDLTLNPKPPLGPYGASNPWKYIVVGGAAPKVKSSTGTDASLRFSAASASYGIQLAGRLRHAASYVDSGVNYVLGQPTTFNVVSIATAVGNLVTSCPTDGAGTTPVFYVYSGQVASLAGTPPVQLAVGLNVCACFPTSTGPTYTMACIQ